MLEAPTSLEDSGATMKPIHAKTPAHHVPREVRAATTTKRLINPLLVTFAITLTLVRMLMVVSKIAGPHATK